MINKTPHARDTARIGKEARRLLTSGRVGDDQLSRAATVGGALPVLAPGGGLHSWFVPVTVGDRLAAFFQFLRDGMLMRFSSFQRVPGEFDGCPLAADWLDSDRIQSRAGAQRRANETIGEPFLTYDRTPDRLVWAVPLTSESGEARDVYVAGETVYEPPPEGSFG